MAGIYNLTREKQVNMIYEVEIGKINFPSEMMNVDFKEAEVISLAESIANNGILQPLSLRKMGENYELISGKKRLTAAKMCELQTVPCIVYEMNDRNSAIMALVEIIKSQDMSFFEEAASIERLITYYGLTQEEAAELLGKAQSTIANKLRLLRLTKEERIFITKYNLTERHSRALLRLGSVNDRLYILERIVKNKLNVEKSESLIDTLIGKRKENNMKHSKSFNSVTIFLNSLSKAIQMMQSSGIAAESRKIQSDEYIEYRVKIPMKSV